MKNSQKSKIKINANFCMVASEDGQQVKTGDIILISRKIDTEKLLVALIGDVPTLCRIHKGIIFTEKGEPLEQDPEDVRTLGTAKYLLRTLS